MTRDDFVANRRKGIGASDVGAILGYSPFATIHDIFLEKLGLGEREPTEAMETGTDIEAWIVEKRYIPRLHREMGAEVCVVKPGTIVSQKHEWLRVNPDGLVFSRSGLKHLYATADEVATGEIGAVLASLSKYGYRGELPIRGLEVKNSSEYAKDQYGFEGSDEIPKSYILQCQISMEVCDLSEWDVAVFLGGRTYRRYRIMRDQKLIDSIIPKLKEFWDRVQNNDPPPVDATESSTRMLNALFPGEPENSITSTAESIGLVQEHFLAKNILKQAKVNLLEIDNMICAIMKDAEKIVDSDFVVTWKANKPRKSIDYPAIIEEAGVGEELINKHTTEKPAKKRTFTVRSLSND